MRLQMSNTQSSVETDPPAAAPELDRSGLLPRVLRNSLWIVNGTVLGRALTLLRGVLLARLLAPADFGLFNLASIVISSTVMMSDIGGGTFLIYHQEELEAHVPTAFWINLGVAMLLGAGVAASAPWVAGFYGRPELVPILRVLSIALWLQSATNVHRNLLRRDLRFRALATVDSLASLALFVSALLLAWRGFGVWSFVLSTVLANLITLALVLIANPSFPRLRVSPGVARAMMKFSAWYVGQAVLWQVVFNTDNLMVGKLLGMAVLGIYSVAYSYAMMPVVFVTAPLLHVVFAELPRLYKKPEEFWRAFHQTSHILTGLVSPIAAALFASAPDLIPLLFGPKWTAAVVPFRVIAIYASIRSMWIDPVGAFGQFKLGLFMGLGVMAASILAIRALISHGTFGVALAVLAVGSLGQFLILFLASRDWQRVRLTIANSLPHLAVAAGAALFAIFVRRVAHGFVGDQKFALVGLSCATVFAIYFGIFRKFLFDFLSQFMHTRA